MQHSAETFYRMDMTIPDMGMIIPDMGMSMLDMRYEYTVHT